METDVYRLISHPLQDPSTLRGGLAIHKKIAGKCRRPFSDPPGDLIDRWEHRDGRGRALWCLLFKTVSYPILEYTLLVALNDTLRGFILP